MKINVIYSPDLSGVSYFDKVAYKGLTEDAYERCSDEEATAWSVFAMYPDKGSMAVADLGTKEEADKLVAMMNSLCSDKVFPNSFESWHETHYEVSAAIHEDLRKDVPGLVLDTQEAGGHGALYELAEQLTNEFEILNKDKEWDGEFFEAIEAFLVEKGIGKLEGEKT